MYQPFFFAELENKADLSRIPPGRQSIRVEIPILDRESLNNVAMGGVGVADLQGILRAENRVEDDRDPPADVVADIAQEAARKSDTGEDKPTKRVIEVGIERSG
jgi:hypothetical protein